MRSSTIVIGLTLLIFCTSACQLNTEKEPKTEAAVEKKSEKDFTHLDAANSIMVLTYDDGMDTQQKTAIPQLNEFGFKGTFFLNNVTNRNAVVTWRNAAKAGHELANHTLFHPCPRQFGWAEEVTTENYTVEQILDEIRTVNSIIELATQTKELRSFAYPCSRITVGEKSYKEDLIQSGIVSFARHGSGDWPVIDRSGKDLDLMEVPSWSIQEGSNFEQLKGYVDKVIAEEGIGVMQFHGIGGEWLSISSEDHYSLMQYLNEKKESVVVATFTEAMEYVQTKQD